MDHKDFGDFLVGDQLIDLFIQTPVTIHSPTRMIVPQAVKEIDDRVKVCFLTASETYYDYELKREFPKLDVRCFVTKPVSIGDLAKVIREQLIEESKPL